MPEGLTEELQALQQRWDSFLAKMEERYNEVVTAGKPEMVTLYNDPEDQYKRAYYQYSSGWKGQLNTIIKKGMDTYHAQPLERYKVLYDQYEDNDAATRLLDTFRDHVHDNLIDWEVRLNKLQDATIREVEVTDWEAYYQEKLDNYNKVKDQFHCKQCSAKLTIPRIFYRSTYIVCEYCKTHNTFEPGADARAIEVNARTIAEYRTRQQLADYEALIYNEAHSVVGMQTWRAAKTREVDAYERYMHAMFEEMHKIIPELKEQHTAFRDRLINDYRNFNL